MNFYDEICQMVSEIVSQRSLKKIYKFVRMLYNAERKAL